MMCVPPPVKCHISANMSNSRRLYFVAPDWMSANYRMGTMMRELQHAGNELDPAFLTKCHALFHHGFKAAQKVVGCTSWVKDIQPPEWADSIVEALRPLLQRNVSFGKYSINNRIYLLHG